MPFPLRHSRAQEDELDKLLIMVLQSLAYTDGEGGKPYRAVIHVVDVHHMPCIMWEE